MSLLRKLVPATQERALDASKFGLALDEISYSPSGVKINQDSAMSIAAVWACVRLLANSVSTLPLDAFIQTNNARRPVSPQPTWITNPVPVDPSTTRVEHFSQVVTSLLLDGNSFTMVAPSVGRAAELHVLDPTRVTIDRRDGRPVYVVRDEQGITVGELTGDNCIHIPWLRKPGSSRGLSPIAAFAQGLGLASAAEEFAARFFGHGATMSGVIEYPEGVEPDDKQVTDLKKSFAKKHQGLRRSHAIGILTAGAKFNQLSVKPNESQFLETQKWTVEQIARIYGIPPHMIQSQEPGAVAFASVEHRSIEYVRDGVMPLTVRIESAYQRLVGSREYVKFNIDGLLRGETKARWESYREAWQTGAMSINQIRALEDMEAIGPDGDMHFVPLNYAPLDQIRSISLPKDPPGPRPGPDGEEEPRFVLNIGEGAIRSETPVTVNPAAITVENRIPNQPTPIVTVDNHIEPTPVDVRVEATVEPTPVVIENRIPEQPAPIVNVAAPAEKRGARATPQEVIVTKLPDRIHKARRNAAGEIEASLEVDA